MNWSTPMALPTLLNVLSLPLQATSGGVAGTVFIIIERGESCIIHEKPIKTVTVVSFRTPAVAILSPSLPSFKFLKPPQGSHHG
jgi:hypothetical protein